MMTDYRPIKSVFRPRRLRTIVGLIIVIFFLLGLSQTNFRHSLTGLGVKILKPFWVIGSGLDNSLSGLVGSFSSKIKLTEENTQLKTIINQQATSLLKQSIIEEENATLKQIFNRQNAPTPLTVGRLLSQGLQFPFNTALVDTGWGNVTAPLAPGLLVVAEGTVVLGELIEVYEQGAKWRFYSAPDDRLTASLGENKVSIELVGRGGGNFTASLPRDLIVAVGDRVTLTIAQHEFLLATVSDIKRTAGDSFQEIFLRIPINLAQLTWVEIYEP